MCVLCTFREGSATKRASQFPRSLVKRPGRIDKRCQAPPLDPSAGLVTCYSRQGAALRGHHPSIRGTRAVSCSSACRV